MNRRSMLKALGLTALAPILALPRIPWPKWLRREPKQVLTLVCTSPPAEEDMIEAVLELSTGEKVTLTPNKPVAIPKPAIITKANVLVRPGCNGNVWLKTETLA